MADDSTISVLKADLGLGLRSLFFALAGLVALSVAFYARPNALGGAELALLWFAAITLYAVGAISMVNGSISLAPFTLHF